MNIVQLVWGDPPQPMTIPSNDITVLQFTTPDTLGPKSGFITWVQYPGVDGAFGGIWPYSGAMNYTPGDLSTDLAEGKEASTIFYMNAGPLIMFRGGPNPPPKQQQLPVLTVNTDYCVNILPYSGCRLPLLSIRVQLSPPRG